MSETLTAERIEEGRRLLAARETHQRCETVGMGWYGVGLPNEADLSIKAATSSRGYLWAPDARLLAWLWNNAPALLSAAATAREQAERIAELEREAGALAKLRDGLVKAMADLDDPKSGIDTQWMNNCGETVFERLVSLYLDSGGEGRYLAERFPHYFGEQP